MTDVLVIGRGIVGTSVAAAVAARGASVVLLEAGSTVKSGAPVVWDRTRSTPSSCENPNRPGAAGGGASYHVAVEIGGIPSQSTQQILLYG